MTLADFQELDRITGAQGCGFLLGFYWIDEQHIQNPMKEKIEIYRWTHTVGRRSRLIKK